MGADPGEWESVGGGFGDSLFDLFDGGASASGGGVGGGLSFDLPPFVPVRSLTATISVAAGSPSAPQEVSEPREMPFSGWLANVRVYWDSGTSQLCGFQLKTGKPGLPGEKVVPTNPEDSFISLENTREPFWLWLPAAAGQPFTLTVQNQDSQGHAIPVIMTAVELTDFLAEELPSEVLPPAVTYRELRGEAEGE